jgi:hypothetical protein
MLFMIKQMSQAELVEQQKKPLASAAIKPWQIKGGQERQMRQVRQVAYLRRVRLRERERELRKEGRVLPSRVKLREGPKCKNYTGPAYHR